jgi:hypothetical protein
MVAVMTIHIATYERHAYRCTQCPYAARLTPRGYVLLTPGDGSAHTGALPWWIARAVRWMNQEGV